MYTIYIYIYIYMYTIYIYDLYTSNYVNLQNNARSKKKTTLPVLCLTNSNTIQNSIDFYILQKHAE